MGEIFDITQFSKIPKEQAKKGISQTYFGNINVNPNLSIFERNELVKSESFEEIEKGGEGSGRHKDLGNQKMIQAQKLTGLKKTQLVKEAHEHYHSHAKDLSDEELASEHSKSSGGSAFQSILAAHIHQRAKNKLQEKNDSSRGENIKPHTGDINNAKETLLNKSESNDIADDDIEKRIIQKALLNELVQQVESSIEKGGLVARKVTIRGKDGKTYQATRWINPDTDTHVDLSAKGGKFSSTPVPHDQIQGHLQGIMDSDESPINKQRKLIAHGIYDKNFLDNSTAAKYKESQIYLKEAGIQDWKGYIENPNEDLPMTNSNPGAFSNPEVQKKVAMTVEEFQSEYGTGKAYEEQARRKDQIMKELQDEFGVGVSINDKWDSYETRLKRLFKRGTPKAVMAYGTGGVGKTYTLEKIRDELGLVEYDGERELIKNSPEYDYVKIGGKIGSREIQRLMFEHSKKTIVFDDCDSMWNDDGLINVLKNALDTSGNGKIQWAQRLAETSKDAGDDVPASFTFSGRMVFITNLSKKELNKAGASPISESRASSVDLTMTVDQTIERLHDILKYVKVKDYENKDLPATMEDKEIALETLSSIKHHVQVHQLNTRTLGKVVVEAMEQREEGGGYNKKRLKQFVYEELGLI